MSHLVYLGLGSNLGDGKANIMEAVGKIGQMIGKVARMSSIITSKPWGFKSDNMFSNAAVCCETELGPLEVLLAAQEIERLMGRTEKTREGRYSDRIIDIDILLYDDLNIDWPDLKIPHPLMRERPFVMEPLKEIIL